MNRKKLVALIMVLALAFTTLVGGTLAYFTDDDDAINTFTIGNVEIDLFETPDDDGDGEWDNQEANLVPGVDIDKNVWVKNTGSNPAYIRVHLAIPSELDDGNPKFESFKNFVHWNFSKESVVDGQWNWHATNTDSDHATMKGWPGNGGDWNYYETKIGDKDYSVYVATYETAVPADGITGTEAITKVYLDATVDGEYVYDDNGKRTGIIYKDDNGNIVEYTLEEAADIQILVVAEATQVDTFTDAYNALDTAFGKPGTYAIEWPVA